MRVRRGRGSEEGEEVAGVRHTSPAVLTDWTWKEMSGWVAGLWGRGVRGCQGPSPLLTPPAGGTAAWVA